MFFIITVSNVLSYGLRKRVKLHVLCLFTQYKVAKEEIFTAVLHPKSQTLASLAFLKEFSNIGGNYFTIFTYYFL